MGIAFHTIYAPDASTSLFNTTDRIVMAPLSGSYAAQASTDTASTLALTWSEPVATTYFVSAGMIEDATYFVTNATTTGVSLVIRPRLTTGTLAGGTIKALIVS